MPPSDAALVAGRYRLDAVLGRGGAGAVWRAEDERLGRRVAVKEVQIAAEDPARVRTRVLREARAAARLRHPSIIAVYDVVEGERTVHIVMELVEGPDLAARVRGQGPLDPGEAAVLGLDVLAALRAAHAEGVVHRDVKPANVLLPPGGPPKLTDFGIAAVADDASLTATGTVLGSPAYMAPEQARGHLVGPPADLWGLGALLHFAVEGAGPFDRGEPLPTLAAVVSDPPAPAPHAGPLSPVIAALLAKDPAERPDAAEVAARLEAVAAGRAAPPPPAPAPAEDGSAPPAPAPQPVGDDARRGHGPVQRGRRRRPLLPALLVVAVLGVLVAVAWSLLGRGGPAADDPDGGVAPIPADEEGAEPSTADVEPPADPAPEEPADDGSADEEPADEEPADDEPADEEPTDDGPADDGPADDGPADDGAADDGPADDGPADDGPAQDEGADALPAGWTRSPIGPAGASVAHPADWQEVQVSATVVDHRAGSGTYVRTDWTDDPADDPLADWERQAAAFAGSREGYEQLRLEPATVDGHEAAVWEYTYRAGGRTLRAVNVNILAPPYAYAVNVQAPAAAWDDLQPVVEAIVGSFEARP